MGPLLHGFAPIVGDRPRMLILGNMPSELSLAAHQYYGNPRNAFWRIMGDLCGFDAAADYRERTAALAAAGIALWDVLASCRRAGSLDSAVERDSMVPNDFGAFFGANGGIERVYFNGRAAETNFRRLVSAPPPLAYHRLPSTSPAHPLPYAAKLAAWRVIAEG